MAQDDLKAFRLLMADVYELAGELRQTSEILAKDLDQTAAGWHVLSVISDGPRTVASAARRLGLARQSVQRVVDGLAVAGQVERRDNPDHANAPLVALTEQGEATLRGLIRRSDTDRQDLLERSRLRQNDLDQARAVLQRLLAALRHRSSDPA